MTNTEKQYLLIVEHLPSSFFEAVRKLRTQPAYSNLSLVVLSQSDIVITETDISTEVVRCKFESPEEIRQAIEPFIDKLCGVICRKDGSIQYLRMLAPLLPADILVATPDALEKCTNKQLMRASFAEHCPQLTPAFIEVYNDSDKTIDAIEQHVGYPVIVKPANLVSSLLIQSCESRKELQHALGSVFGQIRDIYARESRKDKPQVIVESFLEGDFYSIDAYVQAEGQVTFCPPVAYIPAQKLGIDDFFLYKRFVPTTLAADQITSLHEATKQALQALGLTHSSAHAELVLTKQGWKIIEIGPRLGRFRNVMYKLAYGIDHSFNDIAIHIGQTPEVQDKLVAYCAAYSIYGDREGTLREISSLKELEQHPLVHFLQVYAVPGDACVFAKNGGRALAQFIIASDNKGAFDELTEFIESNVHAVID